MGRKQVYRVISTGELVVKAGFDVNATPSNVEETLIFEFLDDDGYPTGDTEAFSLDELEECD
jgi:hypothetical protein